MNVSSSDWTTRCATFGFESSKLTVNWFDAGARRRAAPAARLLSSVIRSCSESTTPSCSSRLSAFRNPSVSRATFSRLGRLSMTACIIATWLITSRLTAMPWSSGLSSDSVST
jgi:hypothetical protein